MEQLSGYTLVKKIISLTGHDVAPLLEFRNQERSFLEFKASINPQNNCESKDELSWNVFKAVVSMANSAGGCILVGVDDKGKPIQNHDESPDVYKRKIDEIIRCKKQWNAGKHTFKISDENRDRLSALVEIIDGKFDNADILLVLVKPHEAAKESEQCILLESYVNGEYENEPLFHRGIDDVAKNYKLVKRQEINSYLSRRVIYSDDYSNLFEEFQKKISINKDLIAENWIKSFLENWITSIEALKGLNKHLENHPKETFAAIKENVEESLRGLISFVIKQIPECGISKPKTIHDAIKAWNEILAQHLLQKVFHEEPDNLSGVSFQALLDINESELDDCNWAEECLLNIQEFVTKWRKLILSIHRLLEKKHHDIIVAQRISHTNIKGKLEDKSKFKFIGRNKEITELLDFLDLKNDDKILIMTGTGGMGKTTLALEASRRCYTSSERGHYFNYIIWFSAKDREFSDRELCIAPDGNTLNELLNVMLETFTPERGETLKSEKDKKNKIRDFLIKYRTFIIVDNMETITDQGLFFFLNNEINTPTKILGTNRHRAKDGAKQLSLLEMHEDDAKAMLRSRIKKTISEDNCNNLISICRIPKVIEWMSNRLNTELRTPKDLYEELKIDIKGSKKDKIFSYLFDTSYSQASSNAKKILRVLAILPFPMQQKLLSEICEIDQYTMRDCIEELHGLTLICEPEIRNDSMDSAYIEAEEYIMAYVGGFIEKSSAEDLKEKARTIFIQEIEKVCGSTGWPPQSSYDWVAHNLSLLKWVMKFTVERKGVHTIRDIYVFVRGVVPILNNKGQYGDVNEFCKEALAKIFNISIVFRGDEHFVSAVAEAFEHANEEALIMGADVMQMLSWSYFLQQRYDEASRLLESILARKDRINNNQESFVIRTMGLISKETQRIDEAKSKLLHVIKITTDPYILGITYGSLASLARDENNLEKSMEYHQKAFEVIERLENTEAVKAVLYQKYAKILLKTNKLAEAEQNIEKARLICHALGLERGFAHTEQLLANFHEAKGNYKKALDLIREASKKFTKLNSYGEVEKDYKRIEEKYRKSLE